MSQQAFPEELSDEEFIADLVEDDELAKILHVQPKSIPVLRARGKLPFPSYKRGKKTLSSRRGAVEHIKASFKPYCP